MRQGINHLKQVFGLGAAILFTLILLTPTRAQATSSITTGAISPTGTLVVGEQPDLTASVVSGTGSGPTPTGSVTFNDNINFSLGWVNLGSGGGDNMRMDKIKH